MKFQLYLPVFANEQVVVEFVSTNSNYRETTPTSLKKNNIEFTFFISKHHPHPKNLPSSSQPHFEHIILDD